MKKGPITFRWTAWGTQLVAGHRNGQLAEKRFTDDEDREPYLVKLDGDNLARAIGELVIAGYADDPRAPKWLARAMAEVGARP